MSTSKQYPSKADRSNAGVSGGLAEYFNQDPLLVRIGFFVFSLCATAGVWVYIFLWLLVPEE